MASNDMDALEVGSSSVDDGSQRRGRGAEPDAPAATAGGRATGFATALAAGGLAGTSVDVALYPIDTLKVRLQSPQGFLKAGGVKGIYNGLGAAAIGSAPGAALFFCTYETLKPKLLEWSRSRGSSGGSASTNGPPDHRHDWWCHMAAASAGEVVACLVRVPTEVVKAKMQTSSDPAMSLGRAVRTIYYQEAFEGSSWLVRYTGGLYRGFGMTLFREIPFAVVQFPLYERFKLLLEERNRDGYHMQRPTTQPPAQSSDVSPVTPLQAAGCGSLSGAIAGAVTTPLDVLKTRAQLGRDRDGVPYRGVLDVLRRTLRSEEGGRALWSGLQPRVAWISIGGFVFFGAYETARAALSPVLDS
jgi:solute carrier family 25 S-adenosylmethionine transporter 26